MEGGLGLKEVYAYDAILAYFFITSLQGICQLLFRMVLRKIFIRDKLVKNSIPEP